MAFDPHLAHRFGDTPETPIDDEPDVWRSLAARGSVRAFQARPVDTGLILHLCALALCAPTKSDLQQRDIVRITDQEKKSCITSLVADQPWVADVPSLLIFCGNNRRQRQLHDMRGHPFVNDHLDAFFNAAVDAGIVLSAFLIAAESVGLGCCPISGVRNRATELSALLELPNHVFPVAGLAFGWPADKPTISPRLPLSATLHENTFSDANIEQTINDYDQRRESAQPYTSQRNTARFGKAETYGWSEDKARQYADPERQNFGTYIRNQGFKLD